MRKYLLNIVVLALCIGGIGVIGTTLTAEDPECADITDDEIAMSRSRLGFRQSDLSSGRAVRPSCEELVFSGTLEFRQRNLELDEVVDLAADASWVPADEVGDAPELVCFERQVEGWERIELTLVNDGGRLDSLQIGYNPLGACQDV